MQYIWFSHLCFSMFFRFSRKCKLLLQLNWSEHCPNVLRLRVPSSVRADARITNECITKWNNKLMFLFLKSINQIKTNKKKSKKNPNKAV